MIEVLKLPLKAKVAKLSYNHMALKVKATKVETRRFLIY